MRKWLPLLIALAAYPVISAFDLTRHSVPLNEILGGGPPKDGIPALMQPKFAPAGEAGFMNDDDRVLGVIIGKEAKAYPVRILNWHEVVNDTVGHQPVAVTYCPLTASGLVYDRRVGNSELKFGVSGQLYQSNLLLYDKQTESLWSQLEQSAVTGPMTGKRLSALPSIETTWGRWRKLHPDTLVLSIETGFSRDYKRDPYASYEESEMVMFPVSRKDKRLMPKEQVFGVALKGESEAFPLRALGASQGPVKAPLGGSEVNIAYDAATETAEATVAGKPIATYKGYWFAWAQFHPETKLWGNLPPDPARAAKHQLERLERMFQGF